MQDQLKNQNGSTKLAQPEHIAATPAELQAMADAGDAEAQLQLADRYFDGRDGEYDHPVALRYYEMAVTHGGAQVFNRLTNYLENGSEAVKNIPRAFRVYLEAASDGDTKACYNVGRCYVKGIGIERDYEAAEQWLRSTADNGHAKARKLLGIVQKWQQQARTIPDCRIQSPEQFAAALKMAHNKEAEAQVEMGMCYLSGSFTDSNPALAFEYLVYAARQNNTLALMKVGRCFEGGVGTARYLKCAAGGCGAIERLIAVSDCSMETQYEAQRHICEHTFPQTWKSPQTLAA